MKLHLTKRAVDALDADPARDLKVYDDELAGFGVVVYRSGRKAFFIEYGPAKRRRRMALGAYGVNTVDQGRALARARLAEVEAGIDPLDVKEAQAAMPTFGEWQKRYMERVERTKKRPQYDRMYLRLAADRWEHRPLDAIGTADVHAAMQAIAERGNPTANRWLASVRACFATAVRDGILTANPATSARNFREGPPRDRVLSAEELPRVVAAFEGIADPHVRAAFVLLMDTGARKSEALNARWSDFDLDAALWRVPSPKAGRPQVIPLAPQTVAFLRTVPRSGPWFCPGRDPTQPREDLKGAWKEIRAVANLDGVTIHDLRRTFGLHVARSAGLHVASKLLRHSDIRITERVYAPLGIDELRDAVADVHGERGKVIELARERAGRGT
ncbi:MAG: DUF4102 domain-containing protein [Myxococcales bacterium]|nr:DUF4102 domain-containing protein [Myxococcales bacterium]